MSKKLFDFVIGNPPYQEEAQKKSETNGQTRRKSVFQFLQMAADEIADVTVLIYPGGRWIQRSGKGMPEFGLKQINDPHLQSIYFYPDSSELFNGVAIGDGVSIVVKNSEKTEKSFNYVYIKGGVETAVSIECPGENIIPLNPNDISIVSKIEKFVRINKLNYLHDRVHSQKLFAIESDFVSKNSGAVRIMDADSVVDYDKEIKLYTNDKAGKAGRTIWFIANRDIITVNAQYIDKWKVVVSSANAGGQKRDNQLEIIDNHSAFGRSRVAIGSFDTHEEAQNFYKYVQSYVIRYAFLMTDEALTTLAMKVPDIESYKGTNGLIDFDKDIDCQLAELIGLTQGEMIYLRNVVDSIRSER